MKKYNRIEVVLCYFNEIRKAANISDKVINTFSKSLRRFPKLSIASLFSYKERKLTIIQTIIFHLGLKIF